MSEGSADELGPTPRSLLHDTEHALGADVDDDLLSDGTVVWWSGAPLAGFPPQFRLRDPDGNSFLVVAAT